MNTERIFQELGLNPILAVTLMESLDLVPENLNDPYSFAKLQSIVDFLKPYSEDAQRFIIRRATVGKQDKLKVLHEYASLLKEKKIYEDDNDKIIAEKAAIGDLKDYPKSHELASREIFNRGRIDQIKEELEIYHK